MLTEAALRALGERIGAARYRGTFDCAYPVYECELELRVQAFEKLNAIEEYVLRVIDLGGRGLSAIDLILGLGLPATRRAVAALLAADLVEDDASPDGVSYRLTILGREALERVAVRKTIVMNISCVVDGFTHGVSIKPSRARYFTAEQVANLGALVMPPRHDPPTVESFDLDRLNAMLRSAAKTDPDRWPTGEVLDLQSVARAHRRYRRLDVVVFEETTDDHGLVVRVFERHGHQPALDAVFAQLLRADPNALPLGDGGEDASDAGAQAPGFILPELWREAGDNAQRTLELEAELANVESEVEAAKTVPLDDGGTTRNQLASLEARYAALQERHAALADQLERGVVRISTPEHRPALQRAIAHAREQVIIVSPWLSRDAIVGDLERWVREAVKRGVRVRIGWGYSDATRDRVKEQASKEMADYLREQVAQDRRGLAGPSLLEIVRLGDTHEKVLIADSNFYVITSFNWLSFRPNPRLPMRRETGARIGIPAQVIAMRKHYEEILSAAAGR